MERSWWSVTMAALIKEGTPTMAGTGRIYRRGHIYYIAYRWEGREYRESARSSERRVAEQLLAARLRERRGSAPSADLTFDAFAAWYLDDYGVRRLRTLDTARGRVANLRAVFGGWPATTITTEAIRNYQRTRRTAGAATVNRETKPWTQNPMSKEVGEMVRSRDVVQAEGSARTEGARRATGVRADGAAAGAGALAPGQRWSASRKRTWCCGCCVANRWT